MGKLKDLTGQKFGRWTVLERVMMVSIGYMVMKGLE